MTRYVSVAMLAAHAKRDRKSVTRALKLAGIRVDMSPGVRGFRIEHKDANRFLAKQWPEVPPISLS